MTELKAADIANLSREFLQNEFGKWFVEELNRRIEKHHSLAEGSDAHNLTVNSVMRAAGLKEALNILENNAAIAESDVLSKL